jgi:hypothetical protein
MRVNNLADLPRVGISDNSIGTGDQIQSVDESRRLLRQLYFSMIDPLPVDWSEQMQAINRRAKVLEEVQKYLGV